MSDPVVAVPAQEESEASKVITAFGEAAGWAIGLFIVCQALVYLLSSLGAYPVPGVRGHALGTASPLGPLDSPQWWNNMARLAVGAGILEEFVFRVLLLQALVWALDVFMSKHSAWWVAAFLQAILFALAHGHQHASVALIRAIVGFALAFLIDKRGYLVASLTHGFYNFYIYAAIRMMVLER